MRRIILDSPTPQIPVWAAEGAVLALWAAAAPVALIAPKALQILVWLLPLASLAVIARSGLGQKVTWRSPVWLVMAIPLYALISAPVSVDPMESAVRAVRLALEFTALCLLITSTAALPAELRRRGLNAIVVGVAIAGAVVLADLATRGAVLTPFWGHAPTWEWRRIAYNRGETSLAMLAPVAAAALFGIAAPGALRRRALWGFAALLLAIGAIYGGASNSSKAAVALGVVVFLAVYALPALLRLLLWGSALVTLAAPWIIDAVPPRPLIEQSGASLQSIVHRTIIWDFTIARIKEKPVLGWGLDASRRMPGGDEEVTISGYNKAGGPGGQRVEMTGQVMPLHPHNGALQIWLELGGIGAALAAALLLLASHSLAGMRQPRIAAATTAASLAAGYSVALVSYGLWQGWWLAALFLVATLPALMRTEPEKR